MNAAPPPILIHDLDFYYGSLPVLKKVDFSLENREFVSVVGPNGGGKTTLLKIILGLLEARSGSVSIFGASPSMGRKWIGYLPQHVNFDPQFPVTVLDVVLMGRLARTSTAGFYTRTDRMAACSILERVGLNRLKNRPFSALSGGQKQRVLIARALISEPKLLLLDEPASNLDGYVERELYDLLKELNRHLTIVVVSHDIGFVSRYVEKVICVNREVHVHPAGKINENILHEMYGEHVQMIRHDQSHRHE